MTDGLPLRGATPEDHANLIAMVLRHADVGPLPAHVDQDEDGLFRIFDVLAALTPKED